MDIFAMLQNAVIIDMETDEVIGHTIGFEVQGGRMRFQALVYDSDFEDEDDPDPGEEDVPEMKPEEVEAVLGKPLKLVAGGQK